MLAFWDWVGWDALVAMGTIGLACGTLGLAYAAWSEAKAVREESADVAKQVNLQREQMEAATRPLSSFRSPRSTG